MNLEIHWVSLVEQLGQSSSSFVPIGGKTRPVEIF